jgi:hypothetical protein
MRGRMYSSRSAVVCPMKKGMVGVRTQWGVDQGYKAECTQVSDVLSTVVTPCAGRLQEYVQSGWNVLLT